MDIKQFSINRNLKFLWTPMDVSSYNYKIQYKIQKVQKVKVNENMHDIVDNLYLMMFI
jgi:hypothetical protein